MIDSKITLYVVSHKEQKKFLNKSRKLIGVGKNSFASDFRDNTGDNISFKNDFYCELTAMYWIWKNDVWSDIVGIEHYRRFFVSSKFQLFKDDLLNELDILSAVQNYDMIVPYKYYEKTDYLNNYEAYKAGEGNHVIEDLDVLIDVIKSKFPNYYVATCEVFFDTKWIYPCNMIICKKEIFNKYCSWLFEVLSYVELEIDYKNRQGNKKRVFGYLAERLLLVWGLTNKIRFYECNTCLVHNKRIKRILMRLKRFLLKRRK